MTTHQQASQGTATAEARRARGRSRRTATSEPQPTVHEQTRRNLIAAMQAEALAHATHIVFAAHARQSGWEELALIFERVAAEELYDHFAKEAELIELAGSDLDNIRASIESEHYEAKAVYGEYAAKAAAAGDSAAAALFEAIRDDKRRHEETFRRALAQAAPELARG